MCNSNQKEWLLKINQEIANRNVSNESLLEEGFWSNKTIQTCSLFYKEGKAITAPYINPPETP